MGGGASTGASTSRMEKRENIRDRNLLVHHVEKFILCVYTAAPRVESMWLILWNSAGQTAFSHFVESEHAEEYFNLFLETNKVRKVKKPTLFVLKKYLQTIIKEYLEVGGPSYIIVSHSLKKEITDCLTSKLDEERDPAEKIFEVIKKLQVESVSLMAREQFNRFLFSKFYKNWRANERGKALAANSENAEGQLERFYNANPGLSKKMRPSQAKNAQINKMKPTVVKVPVFPIVVPTDALSTAISYVDPFELNTLLDLQSWLTTLIGAVEVLPVAFSLSKVTAKGEFPLIYVNHYFESSMLFKRTSVLGWDAKDFLHCPDTEADRVEVVTAALKQMEPVTTVLKNIDGNGRVFNQLLLLQPIKNDKGVGMYVMALHFPLTDAEVADPEQSKRKACEVLMETLPATVVMERNEQEASATFWEGLYESVFGQGNAAGGGGGGLAAKVKAAPRKMDQARPPAPTKPLPPAKAINGQNPQYSIRRR
jgi:hypothetical protein